MAVLTDKLFGNMIGHPGTGGIWAVQWSRSRDPHGAFVLRVTLAGTTDIEAVRRHIDDQWGQPDDATFHPYGEWVEARLTWAQFPEKLAAWILAADAFGVGMERERPAPEVT